MKIKNSDIAEYVDEQNISKTDKVFLKSGLKKMLDEINSNYDETYKKAEQNLKKAQKKYEDDLKSAKEKVLSSSVEKIMDMFNIVTLEKKENDGGNVKDAVEVSEKVSGSDE